MILAALIRAYQHWFCRCTRPHSCCRRGIDAATTLPFLAAAPVVLRLAGDCQHEHPGR